MGLDTPPGFWQSKSIVSEYKANEPKISRHPGNDENLLRTQYNRLRDALDGYYAGKREQLLNVATTIRVLVHDKPGTSSRSLLSRLNPGYWDLPIYNKLPPHPDSVLTIHSRLVFTGGQATRIVRPRFDTTTYRMVPLKIWWTADYQILGRKRLSKSEIILTVADKDGGAHIDEKVPQSFAALSEPPVRYGSEEMGKLTFVQPNMAYDVTAESGCELQEYLERHFPFVK
jgi:hypothetical protein